ISNTILDIEALEVPDHALSDEVGYENWILRDELSVLLEAISILDIGLPAEGESFDISSVETEDLVQVIELESIILTRLITTQLNNANIMDIPDKAYTNEDRTDLLQDELKALGNLLLTLEINIGDVIGEDSDMSSILDNVLVSNLVTIDYEDSYIIRQFISKSIIDGIGTPHELALNPDYPEILSNMEIGEIFKVLETLDEDGTTSLNGLIDAIDIDNISFADVEEMITAGDSILIRGVISENILSVDMIAELSLRDDAFHVDDGTVIYDLISYIELQRMIAAMGHLADSSDDPVMGLMDELDLDTIEMQDVQAMISEESSIVRSLVSNKIFEMDDFAIHPDAIDDDIIYQNHLEDLFNALKEGLGADKTIGDMSTLLDTLNISDLRAINSENSIIIKFMMTDMIIDSIGEEYNRPLARDIDDPLILSNAEFTAIFR